MDYEVMKTTTPNEIPYASEILERIDKNKRDVEELKRKRKDNKKNNAKIFENKYRDQIITKVAEYINHENVTSYTISLSKMIHNIDPKEYVSPKEFSKIVLNTVKDELISKGYSCKIDKKLKHKGRCHGENYKTYKFYLSVKISTCCII